MLNLLKSFAADDSGATAIEYGLIAALVSVAAFTAWTTLGTNLGATVDKVSGKMG